MLMILSKIVVGNAIKIIQSICLTFRAPYSKGKSSLCKGNLSEDHVNLKKIKKLSLEITCWVLSGSRKKRLQK